jgi:hypothetical protein
MKWTLKDVANLTGLHPGGGASTVTFKLFGPYAEGETPDCADDKLVGDPAVVDVVYNGDGTAGTASTAFDVDTPGIYLWTAHFSGNTTNSSADKTCGSEQTRVTATYTP